MSAEQPEEPVAEPQPEEPKGLLQPSRVGIYACLRSDYDPAAEANFVPPPPPAAAEEEESASAVSADVDALVAACDPRSGWVGVRARCLLVEVTPQHFGSHPDGHFAKADYGKPCKPLGSKRAAWTTYNARLALAAERHATPVVRVFDHLAPLWRWHNGNDCTHFCPDRAVWVGWHAALAAALARGAGTRSSTPGP